ncbi:FxSxx-COOH system tetratricopeptide repeat protein [Streptomyces stelliscabiei]|uniref:FxSxx-COOH system tetratricopeptide repeat protein n=1 Tax=Streptomyces stelliscabiei TaxID=146820 RepID=UPI00067BB30F|nr:FxSxx-COOH system tetratricopeptide repeat protein [Streptomyces stelliscabiei]MDX2515896.1 FxSxx-COOH system tetratricopeptide repeat protein [Streptomyces stelliscabiei]MDX2549476.1 FxSxx-COOH system tetratricopeptide repeat protein [Streptomyces stelliscabiei]MDX2611498.1 FxSxx-COOH system tetratricopeptide repeat protein [Streptomyces stelliscabiei]MDX2634406.1 FxSxx-COOH system tetratricopeptide repeat protein [Streptomyces stelliscabiei]MDX2659352.1 FxSxx-COOH system tetratricopeptide
MKWPFKKQPAQPQASEPDVLPSVEASGTRSVAIDTGGGDFLGTALTGDNATAIQLPPEALVPPAEIQAPPGLDNLPIRPDTFVGRARELERLDAALSFGGQTVVQAVHGLGGIGKSTLAAHWAATHPHGRAPVRWINAESPVAVQQGLADLATALQPALAKALTAEALAERAAQWLATHTGWLIVLDNVNDPADITGLLARAPGGRFLITSRLAAAWTIATTVVRLDILAPDESLDLFTRITTATNPGRDLDGAADVCEELGHLPLAIEQAAAYLAQNPLITPRAYLRLLAEHPAAMYRHGAATTPAERTIARIWNVTLNRITELQPQAADLLRTLAWYAPNLIPTTLADGGPADPPALHAALGLLTAYSMITPDNVTGTLAVHRLVQALARTPDPEDPHRTPHHIAQAREQATANLRTALPATWETPATWPTWRTLLPHIDALADHTTADTDTATTAGILNHTAGFLGDQGRPAHAIRHLQRALTACERVLGEDHPDTLNSRNNLALAYRSAGHLKKAIALYERTLTSHLRLDEDHPSTLTVRSNLASAYREAGLLEEAIALYERTLIGQLQVLGEDHPGTLASTNGLGRAYQSAGDLKRAISLFRHALTGHLRVSGEDHPSTLAVRSNLAGAYREAGHVKGAILLCEQNLAIRERVLGKDHPDTLASRNDLAGAHRAAGHLKIAISLHEQTLTDQLRVLGEGHPHTMASRGNLAESYESAGDLKRAIPLYAKAISTYEQVLGEDDPHTFALRRRLASVYRSAGFPDRAIPLYEKILASCERVMGKEHSLAVMARDDLTAAIAERDGARS